MFSRICIVAILCVLAAGCSKQQSDSKQSSKTDKSDNKADNVAVYERTQMGYQLDVDCFAVYALAKTMNPTNETYKYGYQRSIELMNSDAAALKIPQEKQTSDIKAALTNFENKLDGHPETEMEAAVVGQAGLCDIHLKAR